MVSVSRSQLLGLDEDSATFTLGNIFQMLVARGAAVVRKDTWLPRMHAGGTIWSSTFIRR